MPLPIRRPIRRPSRTTSAPQAHSFGAHGEPRTHAEEKRALIHAHAHARAAARAGWGLGYYIGIMASCMVVVTGWWMTTGPTLSLDVKRDPLIQTVTQQTQALKKTAETRALEEERVNDQIKRIQDELEQAKKDAEQK